MGGGGVTASVIGANFGLEVLPDGSYWLEATGGFSLNGGGFASVSATSALVRVNTTGTEQAGKTLSFGGYAYLMPTMSGASTPVVSVTGLQAILVGTFSISGNFAFERDASSGDMKLLATGASAWMTAGEFKAGVSSASVALVVKSGNGVILEASGSANMTCLLYTSPSPRDRTRSRMPSSA